MTPGDSTSEVFLLSLVHAAAAAAKSRQSV